MNPSRIAALLLLSTSLAVASAQDAAPTSRLTKAATVDALDAIDTKPWHALIQAEIFDAQGQNPTKGTIEVWQSGKDRRALYTFGTTRLTEIVNGSSIHRSNVDPPFPRYALFILPKVLHAGPTKVQVSQTIPRLEQRKVGGETLDCIVTQPAIMGGAAFDRLPTYCLDAQDHLRATYNSQQTILLDAPEEFLDHAVSRKISIENDDVPVATAKIVKLETYTPSPGQFAPTAETPLFIPTARISSGVIAGLIVKKVLPIIPAGVFTGGTTVLHVIIGADGHPSKVDVVSAPNPAVGSACVDAVKQWVYKPYLLNGQPVQVETTVTINFNAN